MTKLETIISTLQEQLPLWGATLVKEYLDQSLPYNSAFLTHLDDPQHHKPQWHQWGVITHTNMVLEAYLHESPTLLSSWGHEDSVSSWMTEKIIPQGYTKHELMCIAILLHDIGKFTKRSLSKRQSHTYSDLPDFTFWLHEIDSERIIHSPLVRLTLKKLGLSSEEVFYVGRCAALHYELSKIREHRQHRGMPYNMEFINSTEYEKECLLLLRSHYDYARELGIIYLADTLGKTSFRIADNTPSTLEFVEEEIQRLHIDGRHMSAVRDLPNNVHATKRYFEVVNAIAR